MICENCGADIGMEDGWFCLAKGHPVCADCAPCPCEDYCEEGEEPESDTEGLESE